MLSGILGCVEGLSTIRSWKINLTSAVQSYIASNTKGMTGQIAGNTDWNGSYTAYGHTPAVMPGAAFSFVGSLDLTRAVQGTAIVDSVEININVESAEPISHTVNFSANGALTLNAADVVAADASAPTIFSPIGAGGANGIVSLAPYAASPTYVPLTNVKSVSIKIDSDNKAYVDSSTGGVTMRMQGNLSASISIALNADANTLANIALATINLEKFVRVYVTATLFWEFVAIRFAGVSDIVIDREAAAIVGASITGQFTSHHAGAAGALTVGTIKNPAAATWWPAA